MQTPKRTMQTVFVLLLTVLVLPLHAATCYWNGAAGTTNSWTNAAAWNGGIPGPTDDAVFTNTARGRAVIHADAACGNLTVASNYSNTIVFATGRVASLTVNGDLYLGTNTTILCTYVSIDTNGMGTGRVINVTGNATILGKLSATGQGFPANIYVFAGASHWSAHGGRGWGDTLPYGSLTNPVELGAAANGAYGGGAIKLTVASNLTVNGQFEANGTEADVGGAGGSLWIACASLSGAGSIRADGGIKTGVPSYNGAGGRVALYYTTSTFSGPISAAGYQAGTLWEPGKFSGGTPASPKTVAINESGFRYTFPDPTVTNYCNLSISNSGLLALGQSDVALYGGRLVITNLDLRGQLRFDFLDSRSIFDTVSALSMSNLLISGNVTLKQGTLWLPVQGAYSNISTLTISNGFTLRPGTDTSITNEDSGGNATARHGAGITMYCQNALINGLVSGVGFGWQNIAGRPADGAHGGVSYNTVVFPYGNLTRPSALGARSTGNHALSGGAFSLLASDSVAIGGIVTCAGAAGGGPGGSVRIACSSLSGTGTVSAAGDNDQSVGQGGGRIALEYATSTFTGPIKVDSTIPNPGSKGTVFLCTSPQPGIMTFVSSSNKLDTVFSINGGYPSAGTTNGLQVTRNVILWQTGSGRLRWNDACSTILGNPLINIASYTISGLATQSDFSVYTNSVFLGKTNSGVSGTISITNINLFSGMTLDILSDASGGDVPPVIRTDPPTNVTSSSACLNGYLTATGNSATAVFLYWGTTNGGTNAASWASNAIFGSPQSVGVFSTNVTVAPGGEYYYRYAASNAAGLVWGSAPSYFLSTGLTIGVTPAAVGEVNETGTFQIVRSVNTTSMPLTVYYSISGTASNGVDYRTLGTSVVIAAGAGTVDIPVITTRDIITEGAETLVLTLLTAAYPVGTPGTATLTITDSVPQSVTQVWASPVQANWSDPLAWSAGVPTPIDDAVFTNTAKGLAVIGADASCRNLMIASNYSSTIMFATGLVASLTVNGDLYLGTNTTILCTYVSIDTNGMGTGRVINVTGNANILGKLSATGQGFPHHGFPAGVLSYASHGGRSSGGAPYGSLTNPVELGAGGHSGGGPPDGGGAIRLTVASNLAVNGQIEANGRNENISGAGGSLWITCYALSGAGSIRADSGGNNGAGGRVALYYTNSTFSGPISAAGYQAGTLWEPGKFPAGSPGSPATVFIPESGFRYTFPDSTITNYWDLTISNKNLLANNQGSVDFYGGRLVISNLDLRGNLRFDFHDLQSGGAVNGLNMSNLVISGNVMLKQGTLLLPAQGTYSNIASLIVSNGAVIYCGSDTSVTNEDSGGTASARHGVGVAMYCRDALINGTINGVGLGWSVLSPPCPLPGAYGGVKYGAAIGDRPYGNLTRPSGLGADASGNHGPGGGAFSLFATGGVALNGTATCAGSQGPGGTVRIACSSLSGTGTVSAVGDNDQNVGQGGGRIALEYANSTFTGPIKVDSTAPNPGSKGSVFMCTSPVPGAVTFVSTGVKLDTAFSINGGYPSVGTSNGVQVTRNVVKWQTDKLSLRWTDACSTIPGGALTNIASYTVSGLTPQMSLYIYTNDVLVCRTNSGVSGSVAVPNVNLFYSPTIRVEQPPSGTILLFR